MTTPFKFKEGDYILREDIESKEMLDAIREVAKRDHLITEKFGNWGTQHPSRDILGFVDCGLLWVWKNNTGAFCLNRRIYPSDILAGEKEEEFDLFNNFWCIDIGHPLSTIAMQAVIDWCGSKGLRFDPPDVTPAYMYSAKLLVHSPTDGDKVFWVTNWEDWEKEYKNKIEFRYETRVRDVIYPKVVKKETVEIAGKMYDRHEVDALLRNLTPVREG